jgi:hypothetical protein
MDVIYFSDIYTIKYGDALSCDGPCMELTYDKTKPNILKIDSLQYDINCSIDQLLQHKEATRDMMQSILIMTFAVSSDTTYIDFTLALGSATFETSNKNWSTIDKKICTILQDNNYLALVPV